MKQNFSDNEKKISLGTRWLHHACVFEMLRGDGVYESAARLDSNIGTNQTLINVVGYRSNLIATQKQANLIKIVGREKQNKLVLYGIKTDIVNKTLPGKTDTTNTQLNKRAKKHNTTTAEIRVHFEIFNNGNLFSKLFPVKTKIKSLLTSPR